MSLKQITKHMISQVVWIFLLFPLLSYAQRVELQESPEEQGMHETAPPQTGKKAAQKYFAPEANRETRAPGSKEHYLMMGATFYFDSNAYRWGPSSFKDPAKWGLGVTYRFGEWINSSDFLVRVDYTFFDLDGSRNPQKLSFIPLLVFPDARSEFPFYFGVGAGMGIFTKQLNSESRLSLDYQVFLGLRFFDLLENTGFFFESGIKNHFHLLSSGQLNSIYITVGSLFTF